MRRLQFKNFLFTNLGLELIGGRFGTRSRPEVKDRLEWLEDQVGIVKALERDVEIEADPSQAITLAQLNSEIRNRRK